MSNPFFIRHLERIGSTNDEARRLAAEGAPHGTVVHADEQTAGRGRMAHRWVSPPGNLYVSLILRTGQPPARAAELGFVASLAVADTVVAMVARSVSIVLKWPNDVLVEGGKIAGILLEQVDDATIVGIGVNVHSAPANMPYQTASIAAFGAMAPTDTDLVLHARDTLLACFHTWLRRWDANGFDSIRQDWLARSYALGAAIRVNVGGQAVAGQFAGLDPDGALLLDEPAGRRRIVAGEVSVIAQ